MKGGRFSSCCPAVGSSCQLRDSNKQQKRKDFQTGKGRYTKADQRHEDQCFGPGASALYLEECCAARGNNSVSVLCSSYECIRNFFTAEGRAPRQMQEACAGEVRSAASYPTPFSPLWADRVARSVTKRKWCGSLNWQGGNFFFFFWSGLHLQFTASSFLLKGGCDFAVLRSQPPFLLFQSWWSPEAGKAMCSSEGHTFPVSLLLAGFVCRHWLEYPVITFSHFLI